MESLFKRIEALSDADAMALSDKYCTHNYHPLPVNVVRARDCFAYDGEGKKYIDCVGSYSAVAHGHLHPTLVAAVNHQLKKLTLTSRAVYTSELALFLQDLCEYTQMDMACPMNTGAEAIETALKLARKWAHTVKGVPDGQAEIIVASENFHGRTITIISFSSEEGYKKGFGPLTPGFKTVPFGDIDALKAAITPNTAAVLMEPIQAEAGILFPPAGFMAAARELCTAENVLLIWDEIQTGFCRTGKPFAWQHEDSKPDMMCLGKALGGGLYPVSAVVGKRSVMEVFRPGDHGSTFGGNPLAALVGLVAIDQMKSMDLAGRSAAMGEKMKATIEGWNHPAVDEVRGRGLLIGLEVKSHIDSTKLTDAFLERGVLTKETRHRTFRFAPPLTTPEEVIDDLLSRIKSALDTSV